MQWPRTGLLTWQHSSHPCRGAVNALFSPRARYSPLGAEGRLPINITKRRLLSLNESQLKFPEQQDIVVNRMFLEDIIENLHWKLVYEVKLTWHDGSRSVPVDQGERAVGISTCFAIISFLCSSYYKAQWFRAYAGTCSWGSCWELGFCAVDVVLK
jgi:hypothetical protein